MYYRYRGYFPGIGRFGSRDKIGPIAVSAAVQPYAYIFNLPILWIDPWGLYPVTGTTLAEVYEQLREPIGWEEASLGAEKWEPWPPVVTCRTAKDESCKPDCIRFFCNAKSMLKSLDIHITIELPEWKEVNKAPAHEQEIWRKFISALLEHEKGHETVDLKLRDDLIGKEYTGYGDDCKEGEARTKAMRDVRANFRRTWEKESAKRHDEYHEKSGTGPTLVKVEEGDGAYSFYVEPNIPAAKRK